MMRRSITVILVAGAVLPAVPATAAAQSTPAPVTPKLSITTEQVTVSGGRASVLTGRQWRVRVVLKPMVLGGLGRALRLGREALQRELQVVVTSSLDGAVARAGAAHLAAALGSPLAAGLATGRLFDPEQHDGPVVRI